MAKPSKHSSDYDRWLDRTDAERPPVDLLRPYEAGEMTAHEVAPRVGNVRNNEPGTLYSVAMSAKLSVEHSSNVIATC